MSATFSLKAQTQAYGVVDTADLKLSSCDFEKGANAMVLFDEAKVRYKYSTIIIERHKRIKIFNDNGKDVARVRIAYYGVQHDEQISNITAETINLSNNHIEYTPVDKSLIYKQNIDETSSAIVFTFPNVKPGSIIEFKYEWSTQYAADLQPWIFQSAIPTRFSEFQCKFTEDYFFKVVTRIDPKFASNTSVFIVGKDNAGNKEYTWSLKNIHALNAEPYTSSISDNIPCLLFQVTNSSAKTWNRIINDLIRYDFWGMDLNPSVHLNDEEDIVAKVNALKSQDEKIAYLFDMVKNTVTWNAHYSIYANDGVKKAWDKKSGNSAEVNMILYHFLKKAGINVYPMTVSASGRIDSNYATIYQLNRFINYIKVDSTKQYILDATDKYNVYNEAPFYLLNSNGLLIYPEKKSSQFIEIKNNAQKRNLVFINAEIMPGGKIKGIAQITNSGYDRVNAIKKYKDLGEKEYKNYLKDNDNNLKIDSMKFENMEVDSLPLIQNLTFNLDLTGSDGNYIYFSPNLFTGLNTNPFLSEDRFTDIDFKYLNNYTISGRYKIPSGYAVEALPPNLAILMPDKSMNLKRMINEQDGFIVIYYVITFKRSYYSKEEYGALKGFYKRMHEILNEQIVLKK